ncbi:MAG: alpha-L-rhamnosidase, partial [Paenibacillus sp.]|nr:alpha-L-rhamnosidase [Paenibacillus sp.]
REEPAEVKRNADGSLLVDFGKETFGYMQLHGLEGEGTVTLYYGESLDEACSETLCETFDRIAVEAGAPSRTSMRRV